MTVWIVNPYDNLPPEGYRPQRYWLMARAFARAGDAVTLWTSAFSHAHKRLRALPGLRPDARETTCDGDGFAVTLLAAPPYRRNIGLARIVSHAVLAHRWRRAAERRTPPDLIVVSSPPLSLAAAVRRYAAARRVPYIQDVMDAWPEVFARLMPPLPWAPLRAVARRNYRCAAGVSVVARRYAELVRKDYGVTRPVAEFPHGVERGDAAPPPRGGRPGTPLRLVYCGNMGRSYDLATVIDAVAGRADWTLDLAGAGPDEAALRSRAAGCPRIRFHGYLPAAALRALLAAADAGVVPMFDASCVGIPYKLADYACAGLPVLNSLSGETAELLAQCGAGFSYAAGDVAGFAAAAARLDAADRAALAAGARRLAARLDAARIYPDYVRWARACREGAEA